MEWVTTSGILSALADFANDEAWRQFHDRFRHPLVRFGQSMGLATAESRDAAQETLLSFLRAFREGRYDPQRGRLGKWLFGFAFKQVLSLRRRQARDPHVAIAEDPTDFWASVPDEALAEQRWEAEWERAMLAWCLGRVRVEFDPESFRAFELVVCHEKRPAEAAAELGVPIKKVYNAKHRVLQRIRELRPTLEDG